MTTEFFMDHIQPCPQCGERHDIQLVRTKKLLLNVRYHVYCQQCGRTSIQVAAPQEALNCWNYLRF